MEQTGTSKGWEEEMHQGAGDEGGREGACVRSQRGAGEGDNCWQGICGSSERREGVEQAKL